MSNTYYKLVDTPTPVIDGKTYTCSTWRLSFDSFLKQFANYSIYIYKESLNTGEIRAVVIPHPVEESLLDIDDDEVDHGSYEDLLRRRGVRSKH